MCTDKYINRFNFKFYVLCFDYKTHEFVYLFVWGFSSHLIIFHWPLPVKSCKFFTYTRHSWPLSSDGSLTCHTYCDTSQPFIAKRLVVELSLPVLTTYVCPDRGSNPDLPHKNHVTKSVICHWIVKMFVHVNIHQRFIFTLKKLTFIKDAVGYI